MRRRNAVLTAAGIAALVVVPTGAYAAQHSSHGHHTRTVAQHRPVRPRPSHSAASGPVGAPAPSASALPSAPPSTGGPPPAGGFVHPGVLVSRAQLDNVRAKVNAGVEPWKSAFASMKRSQYASLNRVAKPRATVECGSASNPDFGCSDERGDATAAYTDALMWYVTRDQRYADKAIELMNAWSATVKEHTNSNAPLQSGWAATTWARAGEIIRYTYTGWTAPAVSQFATMLRTVYLPMVAKPVPNYNGNWELIMKDAAVGIAVFLDDRAAYDAAIAIWRQRVPAYMYLSSDGPLPKPPPGSSMHTRDQLVAYWQGQATFMDGLAQETCRDFGHTGWGLDAAAEVAETARIQGQDLWSGVANRLATAFEFHAQYDLGAAVPADLCGGAVKRGLGPVAEVAYNALHNRLHFAMPNTTRLIGQKRPEGSDGHFVDWETLTDADNP